ncbi:fungal specific transcription factor domain-containing protein [Colletotrichum musicola]|uniref:Fungal specific transcription factor domain-containing protein n=1 Tax=Colletotrichum musicola TaxID=2175873 RepID=A0A8H6NG08_9PEZI|nr:fungal specific transcription factor domain-containing protein [Colletotrichum musicola]
MESGKDYVVPSWLTHKQCDICRARKIRCDREQPCSRCVGSNSQCTYSDRLKIREKRKRILLTSQYENKIDNIDRRLDEIVGLLQSLPTNPEQTPRTSPRTHNATQTSTPISADGGPAASCVVEGESSLAAQFTFANDFAQRVAGITQNPQKGSGGELQERLEELSEMVAAYRQQSAPEEMGYPHARPLQRPRFHGCELPPIQETVALIRVAESQRLAGTGWIYEYLPMHHFSKACLDVYFSEDSSEIDFIIVNAGLHSIFKDYSNIVRAEDKEKYLGYAYLCRGHLETGLSNLPLHMPATSQGIIALIFGAFHSIELSKPFLAWSLSSKASEMCQSLGYHRISCVENGTAEDAKLKSLLFWSTYFIDKSLSLRLGRASTIPEWTITTSRPSIKDSHQHPALAYFVLWVETARCQGSIYEMLYSPDAALQPDEVLRARVLRLVSDLQELEEATSETNRRWGRIAKDKAGDDLLDFYATSDETLRLSLLTMAHRAERRPLYAATTFNADCVGAARATLERHRDCVDIMRRSTDNYLPTYFQWTLLFAPFMPFVVMFCHVVETQDGMDLERLGDFVESIQTAAHVSDAASKAHRLFLALHGIAVRYIARIRPVCAQDDGCDGEGHPEMDWFMTALGIPPPGHDTERQQSCPDPSFGHRDAAAHAAMPEGGAGSAGAQRRLDAGPPMVRMGNEAELESWLCENEDLMEMLQ